mmetsp:Transcript_17981/g.24730  ORF Transcript_17981/g.24730 Transcript_17981/m.24730 type:complete len:211 (+) Transcript_17981:286-918(+)
MRSGLSSPLKVECSKLVSRIRALLFCQVLLSPPTSIQQLSFGISIPRWAVRMKLRPSECGATPVPGRWRANITPRTASGISSASSRATVLGKRAQFSRFQRPRRCSRTLDQPAPMAAITALSPRNSPTARRYCWNSSWITSLSASRARPHANSAGSHHGRASRPSTYSSQGWCSGPAGSGAGSSCLLYFSNFKILEISVAENFSAQAPLT